MNLIQTEAIKARFRNRPLHNDTLPPINPKWAISTFRHHIAVQKALRMIEARMQDLPSLSELGSLSGLGRTYFSNVFKEVMGMRLQDYLTQSRLDKAKDLLGNIDLKVKQIAY